MQIQLATCPACGGAYHPLRAQAVTVIDGRVRAFCSAACRERGLAPPAPTPSVTEPHAAMASGPTPSSRGLPAEQKVLIAAAVIALGAFVVLIAMGRHRKLASPTMMPAAHATSAPRPGDVTASGGEVGGGDGVGDVWLQPLARSARSAVKHDRRLFFGREGLPASECGGARCAVEVDASAGAVVMAVHDGVVEAVERSPKDAETGRFVRLNHRGGAIASTYFELDGIREDLRPGIPVKAGEPIGTVAHSGSPSTRPHLRFAMSVSHDGDGAVLFIDPQPLLALWPMRRDAPMSLHAMQRAPSPAAGSDDADALGSR